MGYRDIGIGNVPGSSSWDPLKNETKKLLSIANSAPSHTSKQCTVTHKQAVHCHTTHRHTTHHHTAHRHTLASSAPSHSTPSHTSKQCTVTQCTVTHCSFQVSTWWLLWPLILTKRSVLFILFPDYWLWSLLRMDKAEIPMPWDRLTSALHNEESHSRTTYTYLWAHFHCHHNHWTVKSHLLLYRLSLFIPSAWFYNCKHVN